MSPSSPFFFIFLIILKTCYVSSLPSGLKRVAKDGGGVSFSEPTQTHTKTTREIFHNPRDCVGFPGRSAEKNLPANAGDLCSIPGSERSLEKEMATRSSILAWRIPGTKKPSGLLSKESQRVGDDLVTKQQQKHTQEQPENFAQPLRLYSPNRVLL